MSWNCVLFWLVRLREMRVRNFRVGPEPTPIFFDESLAFPINPRPRFIAGYLNKYILLKFKNIRALILIMSKIKYLIYFYKLIIFFEMCEPPGNQKCQGEKLNQKYNDISQSMNKNRLWNLKICFQIMCFLAKKMPEWTFEILFFFSRKRKILKAFFALKLKIK